MKIRKVIIPVAGFGTRFLPYTKAAPKEMLPIVDKPVIQFIVEEAVRSGIEEVILITGQNKRAIEDHFDYNFELEELLKQKGKENEFEEIRRISDMAKFIYVRQKAPLGNGHAVLCAKEVVGNEPFAVVWGDDLFQAKEPHIQQLINVFEKYHQPVISLIKSPKGKFEQYCSRYGCADAEKIDKKTFKIRRLVEKPNPNDAPSNLFSIGGYIFTPDIFPILENTKPGKGGEIWLVDAIEDFAKQGRLYGCLLNGSFYDIGSKTGFLKATVAYALEHHDVDEEFREFLRELRI
jgi:UTP--glucose-1-phosphate uridylyltransferase